MSAVVFLGSLIGAIGIGMPIAFALLVCAIALMVMLGGVNPQILAQKVVDGADSYPLMAVPFFLLAGELMNAGGLSKRIAESAGLHMGFGGPELPFFGGRPHPHHLSTQRN